MLGRQTALVAVLTVVAYAVVSLLVLMWFLMPTFSELEEAQASRNVERCRQALLREVKHLNGLVADWAAWDDTYAFVDSRDPAYVRSNIADSTFIQNDLTLICITNTDGQIVASRGYDPHEEHDAPFPEVQSVPHSIPPVLLNLPRIDQTVSGVWMTASGPMLVAARPIITSKRQGPPKGTLIMAKPSDAQLVRTLADQTAVSLQQYVLGRDTLDEAGQVALASIDAGGDVVTVKEGLDTLLAYGLVSDIEGRPALLFKVSTPRHITARGRQVIHAAFLLILAAGAILGIVLVIWMHRRVVMPLQRIGRHFACVGETGDHTHPLNLDRHDEFGQLSRAFDAMVDRLAKAREALATQAYREGRAETASAVLHDMRNQMMPLASALSLVRSRLDQWPVDHIEQAVTESVDPRVSTDRRSRLEKYLRLWCTRFPGEAANLRDDIARAEQTVNVMEQTLARRDDISKQSQAVSTCSVQEIAFEALRLIPNNAKTDVEFVLAPELDQVALVRVPRHVTIQLVAGLLANASEASREVHARPAHVTVTAHNEPSDGVSLVVLDSGPGVPDVSAEAIFQRNASRKHEAGFGMSLHECANQIRGLGGSISVKNREDGHGAEVHLHLPEATRNQGNSELSKDA